jgi:GH24 family phage-related lysozyme (muramidase)
MTDLTGELYENGVRRNQERWHVGSFTLCHGEPKTRTSTTMKKTTEEAVRKAAKQLAEKQDTRH